jgi:hypothetical protein
MDGEFISERQAALMVKITPKTLLTWRSEYKIIPSEIFKIKQYYKTRRIAYNRKLFKEWHESLNQVH